MKRSWSDVVSPYEIVCSCGQSLRGKRQASSQIVSCSGCERKHFIFPIPASLGATKARTVEQPTRLNLARLFLVILGGGAAAMMLIFLLARPYLRRSGSADRQPSPADTRAVFAEGERQLREGNVFLAAKDLNAALVQFRSHPGIFSREEGRRLEQLRRQTDLLAHLLDQSLEQILHQATQHRSDEEWNEKIRDYLGRSIVFDDVLRLDAQHRPTLATYVVSFGAVEARVALEDLALLRQLPLDPPRRWLFGARLADCRRERGGTWVFRFEPESAVLLSDESIAAACCPQPLGTELLEVLKRQEDWLRR
jgi:hypothetical protein